MKIIILPLALLFSLPVYSDELIQMSNGMTCWQNSYGHVYGCSGGEIDSGDTGFNDVYSGTRYEYTDQNQGGAYDTSSGTYFDTPYGDQ